MSNLLKKSSVSVAIQNTMVLHKNKLALISDKPEHSIKIASTLEEREAVFQMSYQVYLEKGYLRKNDKKWLVENYDFDKETIIFMVQDTQKNVLASVTIVFEECSVLPAQNTYFNEISILKKACPKLAEISRLVISPDHRNAKEILILLFNYLAVYVHQIKQYDGFVIQVNPRHKNYYQNLLKFVQIGGVKPCAKVQNSPAVLLFLSTKQYQAEVNFCKTHIQTNDRSLYPYALKPEQEKLVAYYLKTQKIKMTPFEKKYFSLSALDTGRFVVV